MSRVGDDRAALWATIQNVLPGRVYAYPPPTPSRIATPCVWIDAHAGALDAGAYMTQWAVIAAADGADHAQLAILDDVASAMWAACTASASPVAMTSHESMTVAVAEDVTVRGVTFTVSVFTGAATFCPSIPEPASIPTTRGELTNV